MEIVQDLEAVFCIFQLVVRTFYLCDLFSSVDLILMVCIVHAKLRDPFGCG